MSGVSPKKPNRLHEDQMLQAFRRSLGYLKPMRARIIWLFIVSALGAAFYSMSIGSILPVLKVMVEPEGLHGWIDRCLAEQRLRIKLGEYDSQREGVITGAEEHAAIIREVEPKSQLHGKAVAGDIVLAVDGEPMIANDFYRVVASAKTGETIAIDILWRHKVEAGIDAPVVTLPRPDWKWSTLRNIAAVIPREKTYQDRLRTLMFVLGMILLLSIAANACRFASTYITEIVSARAIMDVRRQMSRSILALPITHHSLNITDTMTRFVQDTQELKKGYTTLLQKMLREPLRAIGVLTLALLLDWRLTFILIAVAPAGAWMIRRFGKKVRRANLRLLEGYSRLVSAMEGILVGMRVVKGYTMEAHERKRLFQIERQMLRSTLKMEKIDALSSPVVETIAFLGAAGCILWLGHRLLGGDMRPADFASTVILLGAMFDPLRKLSNTYVRLQRANAAGERIFELIDLPGEEDESPDAVKLPPIEETIEFRNVTFTYPGAERPALVDVNLKIKKGEVVAIVGPNGSGKTTLISTLLRFFEPQSGAILLDGRDVAQATRRSLRRQICLTSQETIVFGDTIRSNIAYGKHSATDAEIHAASKRAFADEFISKLPDGYDTLVGEHGATLSGGQRQRIVLARAILRDAPIFIFDEATSQIDTESELRIHQALDLFLRGRTAFMIAHRISTVNQADRIVVMDDGRVIAVGSHATLMDSCALYRRLYEKQFRDAG